MVKKPVFYFLSLFLVLGITAVPSAFAQEEPAAPKIFISFGDEEETAPAAPAQAAQPAATTPTPSAADGAVETEKTPYTDEEILFAIYGWFLVHRNQVDMINITKKERLAFLSGVNTALNQKVIPGWEEQMDAVQSLMDTRWGPVYERLQRERKAQTVELFAGLTKQQNVKKSSTGLFYELISEGTGKFPTADSAVDVEFVATLVDGTVFESTEDRGGPIPIVLTDMVPGVREGLQNVREGGIIKLWVPASLGFGSEEKPGIPADSALLFEFTLHEITDTAPVTPAQ